MKYKYDVKYLAVNSFSDSDKFLVIQVVFDRNFYRTWISRRYAGIKKLHKRLSKKYLEEEIINVFACKVAPQAIDFKSQEYEVKILYEYEL